MLLALSNLVAENLDTMGVRFIFVMGRICERSKLNDRVQQLAQLLHMAIARSCRETRVKIFAYCICTMYMYDVQRRTRRVSKTWCQASCQY